MGLPKAQFQHLQKKWDRSTWQHQQLTWRVDGIFKHCLSCVNVSEIWDHLVAIIHQS